MPRSYQPWQRDPALGIDARAASGLVAVCLLVQLSLFDRSMVPMDEGHLVAAADRVLRGDLLYRDVHTGIAPGIYWITATLFGLFGRDLIVTRGAQLVVNLSIVLCLWRLGLRAVRPAWALLAPLLYVALIPIAFPVLTMFNYSPLSLAFGLAALVFLLRYLERGRTSDGLAVGAFVAACALTKQSQGALVGLAIAASLFWTRLGSALEGRSWPRGIWPIAASGGGFAIATLLYFVASGSLSDFLHATFLDLVGSQVQSFRNPVPPLLGEHPAGDLRFVFQYSPPALFNYWVHGEALLGLRMTPWVQSTAIRLSYALPLLVLAGAPLLLWRAGRATGFGEQRASRAIVLFAVLFFLGLYPSAIWSHLAFVLPPVFLLLAMLSDSADRVLGGRSRRALWTWRGCGSALLACAAIVAIAVPGDVRRWNPLPMGTPHASVFVSADKRALHRGALRFIEECAAPGESIFTAPVLPILYFLSDRPNPTPYDLAIPGNVDGRRIVVDLERTQTRCLVYNPKMYLEYPPFAELFPELDRYLKDEYRRVWEIRAGRQRWQALIRRAPDTR